MADFGGGFAEPEVPGRVNRGHLGLDSRRVKNLKRFAGGINNFWAKEKLGPLEVFEKGGEKPASHFF